MHTTGRLAIVAFVSGIIPVAGTLRTDSPRIPFAFVENLGQAEQGIRYIGSDNETKAFFRDDGVDFQRARSRIVLKFAGAQRHPVVEGAEPIGAVANYFNGSDSRYWKTNLPLYGAVCYRQLWLGIDARFRSDRTHPKSEYVIAPGASIEEIRLRFDGRVTLRDDGGITVSKESEPGVAELSEEHPLLFQEGPSGRSLVQGRYRLYDDGTVGFSAGNYDRRKTLVVDPTILFSGYFGDGAESDITGVAINSFNNVIVAGWTLSSGLPAAGGAQSHYAAGVDVFVAGFSPAGGQLLFCTYLGGAGDDRAFGVTVDSSNNTYITGWTSSSNFPLVGPVQSKLGGTRDAFVTKLNPAGSAIIFSTYLGGSGVDVGYAIALDSTNAPVIVGDTTSPLLPATTGTTQPSYGGNQDAFVAKLAANGHSLAFMTYIGGNGQDHGAALTLDATNAIYVGGSTYSSNFPVQNAAQSHSAGGQDGFVAKLSAAGNTSLFSTYYGGAGGSPGAPEQVNAIVVIEGSVIVAGTTSSTNFPVTKICNQATYGGGATDGFVGRFDATSGALTRSTYFGGSGDDGINALAVDFYGFDFIAGYSDSTDLPVQNAIQSGPGGGMDAFVAKLNLYTLAWGTYLGGPGNESANALALDSMTSVVVVGQTGSSNYPVQGSLEAWQGATLSPFVTKISPVFMPALVASPTFIFDVWHDTGYNGPNITLNVSTFGLPGDQPVAADWDGTGIRRIGVFRNGLWLLDINGDGVYDAGDKTVTFGQTGDIPIVGDWNGTGKIKLGLFRQGTFILDLSGHLSGVPTGLTDATFSFGLPGDIPVSCDWNQSGKTKVGVFRGGQWLVDYNGDQVFNSLDKTYSFGQAGDLPVIGDWLGDGIPKIGVYRSGLWILDYGGVNKVLLNGLLDLVFAFGSSSYIPLVL